MNTHAKPKGNSSNYFKRSYWQLKTCTLRKNVLTVSAPSLPTAFAKKPATTSATVGLLSLLLQTCTLSILTKMMKLQHEKKPVLNLKNREKERERD